VREPGIVAVAPATADSNEKKNKRPARPRPKKANRSRFRRTSSQPRQRTSRRSHLDPDRQHRRRRLSQEERPDRHRSEETNFAVFADGTQQTITNFSTPEAPITVSMVVEYSKWSEYFGYASSRGYEPGTYEVIRPTAMFLSQFIKPPDDYVSGRGVRYSSDSVDRLHERSVAACNR
jgi:hypothetical protein